MRMSPWRVPRTSFVWLALGLNLAFAAAMFVMVSTEWREFRLSDGVGVDQAYYNQIFYTTLHGPGWFYETVLPPARYLLTIRISPTYFLMLPIYALWQSPLMLFALAALGVATCGMVVLLVARRLLGGVVALAWFGLFALHPSPVSFVVSDGFREIVIAMALLSLALLFYIEERWLPFFVMLALAVGFNQDLALMLPFWGLIAAIQRKGRRLAVALVASGLAYFLIASGIVLPVLRGGHPGEVAFPGLGNPLESDLPSIVRGVRALLLGGGAGQPSLLRTLRFHLELLRPLLFLPLLGPEYLAIAFVPLAGLALSAHQYVTSQYLAPAMPFIFVAAIVGMRRLIAVLDRIARLAGHPGVMFQRAAPAGLLCVMFASSAYWTPLFGLLLDDWPVGRPPESSKALFRTLQYVPADASLAVSTSLASEVPSRLRLAWVSHQAGTVDWIGYGSDYLALDRFDMLDERGSFAEQLRWLLCSPAYGLLYYDHEFGHARFLLKRGADASKNTTALYDLVYTRHVYKASELPSPALYLSRRFKLLHWGGVNGVDPSASDRWVRVGRPDMPLSTDDTLLIGPHPENPTSTGSDAEPANVLPGRYRADFYLKIDRTDRDDIVARVSVEVLHGGGDAAGLTIRTTNFPAARKYVPFSVLLTVRHPDTVQFRVRYPSRTVTLWVDRIDLRLLHPDFDPRELCRSYPTGSTLPSGGSTPLRGPGSVPVTSTWSAGAAVPVRTSQTPRPGSSGECPPAAASPPIAGEGLLRLAGVHDFAVVPAMPAFGNPQMKALTLEAWVYPLHAPSQGHISMPVFWNNWDAGYVLSLATDGELTLRAGGRRISIPHATVAAGRWSHVAVTLGDQEARLYLNGTLLASGHYPRAIEAGVYRPFIGFAPVPNEVWTRGLIVRADVPQWFTGYLAGLRFWNRVLDAGAIRAQMTQPLGGKEPGLIGYWRLDASRPDLTVADRSPARNTLLLGNPCMLRIPGGASQR